MIKIVQLSDIHIRNYGRYEEYEEVFNRLYETLKIEKPNIICNLGDTFDQFIDISNEAKLQAGNFLNNLTLYCDEVIVVVGNHDIRKRNLKRINSIETIVKLINNPKIKYFDTSNFYTDETYPIIWVNHSHLEKNINPWRDIPHIKKKDRIYIDLFHDPINGAYGDNGIVFNKSTLKDIKEFKGDISLFGDLHKSNQEISTNKKYSGSLIQQSFGEEIEHGIIVWEIDKNKIENRFIRIQNDYVFVNININCDVDYDNLNLTPREISKYNKFKVNWTDLAVKINNENETKIRKYLKETYDAVDIEIKPNRIYTDIKDGKMLSEILNISDMDVQQNIIMEYLKENKYEKEFISKIIEIDDVINERLESPETKNIIWNIDKLWFNNFRSYGDNNVLDLKNFSGSILLSGINASGKSSIIDVICFVLFGTTISTTKQEKNGNNRYINKYRDLNYCEAGCVLDINGEKYTMIRRVEREIKKGIVKSCPMLLDYYKGTEITEENKLTGENKIKTQQFLTNVLGSIDDYVRMSITNSENLNNLLSIDRSVFIDSLVRDAGYEVFEQKLLEFKNYIKELNFEKINIDETKTIEEIERIESKLKEKENELILIDKELSQNDINNQNLSKSKEEYLRKLHKIDESLIHLNENDLNETISIIEKDLLIKQEEIDKIEIQIFNLPTGKFDDEYYNSINEDYKKFTNEKNKRNLELVEYKSIISQNEIKINNVKKDIENEKINYLNCIKNEIRELEVELDGILTKKSNDYLNKKMTYESLNQSYKTEVDNFKTEGQKIKKEIILFEEMKSDDNAVCPTCNQLISNKDHSHIDGLIAECNNKLLELSKNGKFKLNQIEEVKIKLDELEKSHTEFLIETKEEYKQKINILKNQIDNFNYDLIKETVDNIINAEEKIKKETEKLKIKIKEYNDYLIKLENEINKKQNKLEELKNIKSLIENRNSLQNKLSGLYLIWKNTEDKLNENKKLLFNFQKNISKIEENNKLNELIIEIDEKLKYLKQESAELTSSKMTYSNEITLHKKVIEDIEIKLELYREQQHREELHNVYLKLMHRSGLPTYLLTKNIDLLNKELSGLLTNTDFILFFDEDLNLKIQHSGKNECIDAITASGMERVFAVLCLKVCLRNLNFKSKCNMIMLDEIMNRLVNQSVEKFMDLLEVIKNKIDKIIIIEHNVDFQPDYLISVVKDENGVSSFELI